MCVFYCSLWYLPIFLYHSTSCPYLSVYAPYCLLYYYYYYHCYHYFTPCPSPLPCVLFCVCVLFMCLCVSVCVCFGMRVCVTYMCYNFIKKKIKTTIIEITNEKILPNNLLKRNQTDKHTVISSTDVIITNFLKSSLSS